MNKYENIKIKKKKLWEISKGHNEHRSGSGTHDSRPKRARTRSNINRRAIQEYL
jgi:hypothetical protein